MRRLILVSAAVIALVAAMIGVGWSAPPRQAAATARPDVHKVFFRKTGGYAVCGITCDSGGKTLRFGMPSHGSYKADITVTFQYRTSQLKSARASFQVGQVRKSATAADKDVSTKPNLYRLAVAPRHTSVTLQFVVMLRGGKKYDVTPIVFGTPKQQGSRWSIGSEKLVYSIDAVPTS